jgi:zinc/manganese transport system substrate-binding protein
MRFVLCLIAVMLASTLAHAQLRVVTTTTDYADLARQIGGGKVEVYSIMRGPENTHNIMAKPTEMVQLNRADMFVHAGLDAEPWRDNLLKGARNPRVMPGKPGNVDMSRGIELREVPTGRIDRSMGDIHAFGNPHYHIHPLNTQRMAATLMHALVDLDPANADFYRDNARKFVNDMADTYRELQEKMAPYRGLKIVTYHAAWDYFADAFGVDIVTTIEPQPGITPSPAQMRQTIEAMKQHDVRIVIVETYNSHSQAKRIADAVGAQLLVLPDHVHGVKGADSYQNLFRHNVEQVIEAARAAGIEPRETVTKSAR